MDRRTNPFRLVGVRVERSGLYVKVVHIHRHELIAGTEFLRFEQSDGIAIRATKSMINHGTFRTGAQQLIGGHRLSCCEAVASLLF